MTLAWPIDKRRAVGGSQRSWVRRLQINVSEKRSSSSGVSSRTSFVLLFVCTHTHTHSHSHFGHSLMSTQEHTHGCTDARTHGRTDARTHGRMDAWTHGRADARTHRRRRRMMAADNTTPHAPHHTTPAHNTDEHEVVRTSTIEHARTDRASRKRSHSGTCSHSRAQCSTDCKPRSMATESCSDPRRGQSDDACTNPSGQPVKHPLHLDCCMQLEACHELATKGAFPHCKM